MKSGKVMPPALSPPDHLISKILVFYFQIKILSNFLCNFFFEPWLHKNMFNFWLFRTFLNNLMSSIFNLLPLLSENISLRLNLKKNCWEIFYGSAYDLSCWIFSHARLKIMYILQLLAIMFSVLVHGVCKCFANLYPYHFLA